MHSKYLSLNEFISTLSLYDIGGSRGYQTKYVTVPSHTKLTSWLNQNRMCPFSSWIIQSKSYSMGPSKGGNRREQRVGMWGGAPRPWPRATKWGLLLEESLKLVSGQGKYKRAPKHLLIAQESGSMQPDRSMSKRQRNKIEGIPAGQIRTR